MRIQSISTFRRLNYQRGVVLIFALIVLVALIVASIALVRSVDITTQIAGNLAYRQAGVQAADSGMELARKWLISGGIDLTTDHSPSYYSTWNGGIPTGSVAFDPSTFDWTGKSALPVDAAGNTVVYVVHRMCQLPGDPGDPNKNCVNAPTSSSGNSNRIKEGGEFACVGTNCITSNNPYYRITVRVTGPRNTVTYVQAVIY
jgi:type IV pilus assembly protein PilX